MLRNGQRPGKLQEREPPEGERQEARLAAAEQRLRQRILEEQGDAGLLTDQALRRRIDEEILREAERFSLSERTRLHRNLFNSFRRFGILQELLEDPSVNEIMVNGPESVFLERGGGVARWDRQFESEEQLEDLIQQIVSGVNRSVNTASPIADARLPDGSRVHIVLPPASLCGPVLTIRKFPEPLGMEKMIALGTLTEEAADYLKVLVRSGYNIFISGGTRSGKTTFLNALSDFIPREERVITIEDSAELQLRHIPNLVRLETRNPNSEGEGAITMSALIKASLRMNPDRIVVGEVRGGEAMDMLQAMNTGHDGSLSTGHGNSAADMLHRLEAMVLMGASLPVPAIRSQIASALDLLVHLGRLSDRSRRVLEISEIRGYGNEGFQLTPLFAFDAAEKRLKKTGSLANREKLLRAGQRLAD